MKLRNFTLLVCLLSMFFVHCSKDDEVASTLSGEPGLHATIDGSSWKSGAASVQGSNDFAQILTEPSLDYILTISMSKLSIGSYDLSASSGNMITLSRVSNGEVFTSLLSISNDNVLVVSEIDAVNNTISGTFSANMAKMTNPLLTKAVKGEFNKLPYDPRAIKVIDGTTGDVIVEVEPSSLTAKIDTVSWSATKVSARLSQRKILINFLNKDDPDAILLQLNSIIDTKTYDIGTDYQALLIHTSEDHKSELMIAEEGTVIIKKHDTVGNKIEGIFSFTVHEAGDTTKIYNIREGEFSVVYR